MSSRVFAVEYDQPRRIKEIDGEFFTVDENETLKVFDANKNCILALPAMIWAYIEDVTDDRIKEFHVHDSATMNRFLGTKEKD